MPHASRRLILLTAVVLLGGGCSHSTAASPSTTTAPSTSTTLPPDPVTTTVVTAAPATCSAKSADTIPDGANVKPTIDVDGDGKADQIWFGHRNNERVFGIKAANGRVSSAVFESASGASSLALAVNADQRGPVEIMVINRGVSLFAYINCLIVPITNPQGDGYSFDTGFGDNGTGMGCVDADGDGKRDLVGLHDLSGYATSGAVNWTRTIVRLNGAHATNGPTDTGTYQLPQDKKVDLLHSVTCGNVTENDAVSE